MTFSPPHPLKTAVLFLVFNRPDTTKRVFEAIRIAKPPRLYIAADGPREYKPGEKEKVQLVRDYVINNIDWNCEVKTLFREKNLGCKYAVSSAITWFFENEEMGIILEDDCLPSQSFFWFCEVLLDKYNNDLRIWHISGNNFYSKVEKNNKYSYYFGGIYGSIWGWATWKSRWKNYDVEMENYYNLNESGILFNCYDGSKSVKHRIMQFERIKTGFNTWDYQWAYCRFINSGLTIISSVNLISNIGFRNDATHTTLSNDILSKLINNEIVFPLKHPNYIIRGSFIERRYYRDFVNPTLFSKIIKKLKKLTR